MRTKCAIPARDEDPDQWERRLLSDRLPARATVAVTSYETGVWIRLGFSLFAAQRRAHPPDPVASRATNVELVSVEAEQLSA